MFYSVTAVTGSGVQRKLCPLTRLVDFAVGLMDSVLCLPDGQVTFFGGMFGGISYCRSTI